MTPLPSRDGDASPAALAAASRWFARLNAPPVSVQDLRAFEAWRRLPEHDRAYRKVEALWARGEALRDDPELSAALTEALRRPSARRAPARARVVWAAAACAGVLLVVLAAWGAAGGLAGVTYQTAVGDSRLVHLADGSRVRLDTDSRILTRLTGRERDVRLLQGQAFFDVAHDPARPFLVSAGPTTVRAVGTRFDVRGTGAAQQVVLVQGKVTVSVKTGGAASVWTLAPGQQFTRSAASAGRVDAIDPGPATSWTQNRLVFHSLPLQAALAEVNRYTPHKLVLAAPEAATTPVSGVFDTGDPAGFAAAAADLCGLSVVSRADGGLELRPASSNAPT